MNNNTSPYSPYLILPRRSLKAACEERNPYIDVVNKLCGRCALNSICTQQQIRLRGLAAATDPARVPEFAD